MPAVQAAVRTSILPAEWSGCWQGQVTSQVSGGASQSFGMTLEILPTEESDQLSWTITYDGSQGKSERPYRLVAVDAAEGHFVIDERNGIRIDAVLIDNCFSSHFVVGGQRLWSTYRLTSGDAGPEIWFELMTSDDGTATKSGSKDGNSEVTSLKTRSRQSAVLRPNPVSGGVDLSKLPAWTKLETEPYRGKQDDIFFINPAVGWYVNGAGKIFKTINGGESWVLQLHKPGTYFRCIAFLDENIGFAGNIGPDYFPNVSDTIPLCQTSNGGDPWTEVTTIEGPPIVGLCALQVLHEPFVNAGQLEERVRVIGVGRVGGPTAMIISDDLGKSWQQISLAESAAMAFDVNFFNRNEGFMAAAANTDVAESNALILSTSDGGRTWTKAGRPIADDNRCSLSVASKHSGFCHQWIQRTFGQLLAKVSRHLVTLRRGDVSTCHTDFQCLRLILARGNRS
ncbi:MAG: WD40/YVTN/BNR-like repeat-containing protein [Planctomycetota bacterium]